jgi:hypothetical protein
MSSNAADTGDGALTELDGLEMAVRRMLERYDALLAKVDAANVRVRELEQSLDNVSGGDIDPVALAERTRELEAENRDLIDRLDRAKESVKRILARMRYTEEEA